MARFVEVPGETGGAVFLNVEQIASVTVAPNYQTVVLEMIGTPTRHVLHAPAAQQVLQQLGLTSLPDDPSLTVEIG